jgi:hypothetical protein
MQSLECALLPFAPPRAFHPVLSQAVAKSSNLSAVLAFMSIVHVNNDIVQGILHSVPGQCTRLAEHFWPNPLSQQHHLGMCVIELVQNLSRCSPFAFFHLSIVKLATQPGKLVQVRCRVPPDKPGQDIYQDLFIGGKVGDDVLD